MNHLQPNIRKECWTSEEEELLVHAHSTFGNRWSAIAKVSKLSCLFVCVCVCVCCYLEDFSSLLHLPHHWSPISNCVCVCVCLSLSLSLSDCTPTTILFLTQNHLLCFTLSHHTHTHTHTLSLSLSVSLCLCVSLNKQLKFFTLLKVIHKISFFALVAAAVSLS